MNKQLRRVTFYNDITSKLLDALVYSDSGYSTNDVRNKFIAHFAKENEFLKENKDDISVSDYFPGYDDECLIASNESVAQCFMIYWMKTVDNLVVDDKYFYVVANSPETAIAEWNKAYGKEYEMKYFRVIETFSTNVLLKETSIMFKVTYRFHGSVDVEVKTFNSYEAAQEWAANYEDGFAYFKLENTTKH